MARKTRKSRIHTFKTVKGATKLADAMKARWPGRTFAVLPLDFHSYAVGVMAGGVLCAYVERPQRPRPVAVLGA